MSRIPKRSMAEKLGDIDVTNIGAPGTTNVTATWRERWETAMHDTGAGIDLTLTHIERSTAGAIVIVNTTGSVQARDSPTPHPAIKAAKPVPMKSVSVVRAPRTIRIDVVSPGSISFEGRVGDRRRPNEPERCERMLRLKPRSRFGQPEEVASGVVFRAGPGRPDRRAPTSSSTTPVQSRGETDVRGP
jgi:3-oxoacyl-[acyl-carrier protein] reductase